MASSSASSHSSDNRAIAGYAPFDKLGDDGAVRRFLQNGSEA